MQKYRPKNRNGYWMHWLFIYKYSETGYFLSSITDFHYRYLNRCLCILCPFFVKSCNSLVLYSKLSWKKVNIAALTYSNKVLYLFHTCIPCRQIKRKFCSLSSDSSSTIRTILVVITKWYFNCKHYWNWNEDLH